MMDLITEKLFERFKRECLTTKQYLEKILETEILNTFKEDSVFIEDGIEIVSGFNRSLKYMFGGKLVNNDKPKSTVIPDEIQENKSSLLSEPQLKADVVDHPSEENTSTLNNKVLKETTPVKSKNVVNIQNNCFDQAHEPITPVEKIEIDSDGTIPYQPKVLLNTPFQCFVVHVESPGEFYISLKESYDNYDRVLQQMNQFYGANCSSITKVDIQPNEAYCCFYDGKWLRAIVKSIDEKNLASSYFLDYGFEDNVSCSRLYSLKYDYKDIYPLAFRCHLANVLPLDIDKGWSKNSKKFMKRKCSNMSGTILALEHDTKNSLGVLLNINNSPVHFEIVQMKHAVLKEKERKLTKVPVAPVKPVQGEIHTTTDDTFIFKSLPKDVQLDGVLSHYVDPSHFYIRLISKDNEKLLVDLGKSLPYKEKKKSENDNKSYYRVFHDDKWHRCIITDTLNESKSLVKVYLMDDGSTIETYVASLIRLPRELCVLPPMAHKCHLAGIAPKDRVWSKKAIKQTKISIFGKKCAILVHESVNSSNGITLRVDGVSVNTKILLKEFGVLIEKPKSVPDDIIPEVMNQPMGAEEEEVNLSVAVQGHTANDEAEVCPHYKGPPHTTCFKGTRCKKKHQLLNAYGWTIKRIPALVESDQIYPSPDTLIQLTMTSIINYKSFYGHIINCINSLNNNNMKDLSNLQKLVNNSSSLKSLKTYDKCETFPGIGELVLAFFDVDNQWYRAKVCAIDSDECEVFFIDYGNKQCVKLEQMAEMEKQFSELPPQAMYFVIDNIELPYDELDRNNVACDALYNVTANKMLFGQVTSVETYEVHIILYDSQCNIGNYLCDVGVVNMKPYKVPQSNGRVGTKDGVRYIPG